VGHRGAGSSAKAHRNCISQLTLSADDPTEVADRVYRIGTRWASFYLVVDGNEAVMIDAGYPGYLTQLWACAEAVGVGHGGVRGVIVTHHHVDHAGTAEAVRRKSGAQTFAGAEDVAKVCGHETSHPPHGFWRESWRPSMIAYLLHSARVGGSRYHPVKEVSPLGSEETLDLPGQPRVVATPGHTAGHRSVVLSERGVLFTGDALVNFDYASGKAGLSLHRFNEDRVRATSSLARLEEVDAETLLFGHGDPWRGDVKSAVEEARARL
jgi:glyoxylase-like metal-dependent hydrolase (beta-lactamase superfamily II)